MEESTLTMDSKDGRFIEDGNQLLYHHPEYRLISEAQWLTSSIQNHLFQPLFLCPNVRYLKAKATKLNADFTIFPINSSPVISSPLDKSNALSTTNSTNHHLLPLFWCNNKEFDLDDACCNSNWGTNYYFCEDCSGKKYHKECVESPSKIKHPYHLEHALQLCICYSFGQNCCCCQRTTIGFVYWCTTCEIFMHPVCAMKSIPFVIDPPKMHDHPLMLFPRQSSLTCNVCGLLRKSNHTYICVRCNFVTHNDCMNSPYIIRISRHLHRISYIVSLSSIGRSCGVCHQRINGDYGAYACDKCDSYVVHSKCALGKDVWDGQDLKDIPEEDSITQDARPFDIISEGAILYFLHDHILLLEVNITYDENKFCQACVLPIFEGNVYSCKKCDYILHETCANVPRRMQHALHLHTLTLTSECLYAKGFFYCDACGRACSGFIYECLKENCNFDLDIQCALISEQFMYNGHKHPLFLGLEQVKKPICHVCNTECRRHFKCIEYNNCDYIVCIKCATIPYKIRYKHDKHFLTFSCENKVREKDCCEVCEYSLKDSSTKGFFWCKQCCTTFHIDCLIGEEPYLKVGQYYSFFYGVFQILKKEKISRPICKICKKRCQSTIFVTRSRKWILCSLKCLNAY